MFALSKARKLEIAIGISTAFFVVEIVVGFRQNSLVLIADAFHVVSDLVGFVVALVAFRLADRKHGVPANYSFGFQRAPVTGAFFNGAFLAGLGFSIVLQAIERLIEPEEVTEPLLVLIVGAVGLGLNIVSALVVHDHGGHGHSHDGSTSSHGSHSHSPVAGDEGQSSSTGDIELSSVPDKHADHQHTKLQEVLEKKSYDLGLLGAMVHLFGDALNNLFVIIAAAVIWKTGFSRVDGIASFLVGISILATSIPLMWRSARLLLEAAPEEMSLAGIEEDIAALPGVKAVHEIHIFSLTQIKHIASLHVSVNSSSLHDFTHVARSIRECLHAWGIHGGVSIQPELVDDDEQSIVVLGTAQETATGIRQRCQIPCAKASCDENACC
ncbi:putative Zinc/cadmium resistance protein (putative) [Rhodotorula toruloides]|uniref:BY PROTMAP: gi/342319693/gb/EGU11640.1/ Zinc transporter 1 [Rhodotorula glutinis ATCC 204091] n=1 Tax=Rhodotorula toruloides TaxID=5286 RepID=A0A0K3CRL3_RHOTO|nr:putative Zinc/cadmium resistance protein (putative) [Rhodotorula toruloides]